MHEVRDDWVGQIRPLWVTGIRGKFPRREKTKPGFQVCTTNHELRPRSRQNAHVRPARRAQFHRELCLENLFEQIALVHARRRANAQAFAPLQEDNLVRVLADQIEFVRDDHYGVTIFNSKPPQRFKQIHLRPDIQMQCRLIQQKQQRLLRERPRQNHSLLFSTGNLVHPTVAKMLRPNLR